MSNFLSELSLILDSSAITSSPPDLLASLPRPFQPFADAIPPLAVVYPGHYAQFKKIFALCAKNDVKIRIQGGGTSLFPPLELPGGNWLLVKTTRLARIIELSREDRIITVQAGVTTSMLRKALQASGLGLPGLDGHPLATIGGILADNAAQPEFPAEPPISSHLVNISVLSASAEILAFSAGNGLPGQFNLNPPSGLLFCGTRGCAGLILEASFKLDFVYEGAAISFIQAELPKLINICEIIRDSPGCHPGLMLLDDACTSFGNLPKAPTLLLQEPNLPASDTQACSALKKIGDCQPKPLPDKQVSLPLPHFLATLLFKEKPGRALDIQTCPPSKLAALLKAVFEIAAENRLTVNYFGYPALARMYFVFSFDNQKQWHNASQSLAQLRQILGDAPELLSEAGTSGQEWLKNGTGFTARLLNMLDPNGLLSNWGQNGK